MSAASTIPDWVENTPDEIQYDLEMYDPHGSAVQAINMTREEFIELKRHLAAVRGLVPAGSEGAVARIRELAEEREEDEKAVGARTDYSDIRLQLSSARSLYERCPEAIVGPEELFGDILRGLEEKRPPGDGQ